jgi:hypothetical protein
MREVARTVDEAGIGSWMSAAAVRRQEWAAARSAALASDALEPMLDAILALQVDEPGAWNR